MILRNLWASRHIYYFIKTVPPEFHPKMLKFCSKMSAFLRCISYNSAPFSAMNFTQKSQEVSLLEIKVQIFWSLCSLGRIKIPPWDGHSCVSLVISISYGIFKCKNRRLSYPVKYKSEKEKKEKKMFYICGMEIPWNSVLCIFYEFC